MSINIKNIDCLTLLKSMEPESIDMVFADPPFNVEKPYKGFKDKKDDYYEWCAAWIAECFRVLKPTGSFYLMTLTDHLPFTLHEMAKHGVFVNLIKWRNVSGKHDKNRFWFSYQPICLFGKTKDYKFNTYAQTREEPPDKKRWGKYSTDYKGQMMDAWDDIPNVYAGSITHKEAILETGTKRKAHPCQMPEMLPGRAILFSTDIGDTVYDPFTGSGTTAIAAKKTGRKFVGSEISEEYYKLASERLDRENQTLFG